MCALRRILFTIMCLMTLGCAKPSKVFSYEGTTITSSVSPKERGLFTHTSTVGDKEKTVTVFWRRDDFPLVLWAHPNSFIWSKHVEQACAWWNEKLGFEAFRWIGTTDMPYEEWVKREQVAIVLLQPLPDSKDPEFEKKFFQSWTLSAFDPMTGRIMRGLLWMSQAPMVWGTPYIADRTARHELGHLLGLDHDLDESSLMFGSIGAEHKPYDATNHDIDLLRSLYAKELRKSD